MEQVKFNYSTKNIPISSHKEYLIELIHSVAKFAANLEKRTYYYLNPIEKTHEKETFGFNFTAAPKRVAELDALKDMLYDLVINIKFRKHSNHFQAELKKDIKKIERDRRMLISADKTTNFYHCDKKVHDELLDKSIQKDYMKASAEVVKDIFGMAHIF